jgi:peptidoglycan/xylan/chitin deacetylase (PgdA/CDA1 family)
MYHRVAETNIDPWQLCVSPQHFAEQMDTLTSLTEPVHLANIRERSGNRPRVAITFDDGYADNLIAAKPILQRFSVPATVFVSTGYTGSQTGFWWDRLEEIFLHPGSLPLSLLTLDINGSKRTWRISEADRHYNDRDCRRHRDWAALKSAPPTSRHAAFCELWQQLMNLSDEGREQHLRSVADWAGHSEPAVARCMTQAELRDLFDGDLVHPGGHTVSHCRLSALQPDQQREEIVGCRRQLEDMLSRKVVDFSYPFGRRSDYTSYTVEAVADSGYERACTNHGGLVQPDSDNNELPRVHAADLSGTEFRSWLSTVIDV